MQRADTGVRGPEPALTTNWKGLTVMAIHHLTPPIRGGERPRSPSSQIGPVTQAIRAMRAAEPIIPAWNFAPTSPDPDRQRIRDLRRRIAERIEADIALLDALNGDAAAEWSGEGVHAFEHGGCFA